MRNLDDFSDKVKEPVPEDKVKAVIAFPENYLSKVSLYLILGLAITLGTYLFHLNVPIILNVFYNDIDNIDIQETPFVIMCIVLPIIVPLVVSQAQWSQSVTYQLGFMCLMAVILGSTFAFLAVAISGFVIVLLLAFMIAHLILAILQANNEDFSQGKYATGTLLFLVFTILLFCDLIGDINYIGWIVALVAMTITTYIGYNANTMKRALTNKEESAELIQQKIVAEAVGQFLLFVVLAYPHAFATKGFTPIYVKRRWMGPEDGR